MPFCSGCDCFLELLLHYILSLHSLITFLSLHSLITFSHYILSLHSLITFSHYILSLHYLIILSHYILSLHYLIILSHYILHSHTTSELLWLHYLTLLVIYQIFIKNNKLELVRCCSTAVKWENLNKETIRSWVWSQACENLVKVLLESGIR